MNFKDFRDKIKKELSIYSNIQSVSDTEINEYIKEAYNYIGNIYRFIERQKVQYRIADAQDAGLKYFNYPEYWENDSVFFVKINGVKLDKVNWKHYSEEEGTFSEYRNKIHIPFELKEGDEIEIHGYQNAWWERNTVGVITEEYIPQDNDESIFRERINEAIKRYAIGQIFRRMQGEFFVRGDQMISEAEAIALQEYEKQGEAGYTGDAVV